MRRLFLDTSVLALAAGGEHPLQQPCRALFDPGLEGELQLHVSAEAVQELLFHRMRRESRELAVPQVRALRHGCVVHPIDEVVIDRMFDVVSTTHLGGRDAVHAATALVHGFTEIVSADADFDGVPGLARLDPAAL